MEPKIERTAFNSQRDQIFWHLCGFLVGLWQRQSLLLSEPIRYKRHTIRRAALFESYHLCKYLHLSFLQRQELRLRVRSWCALSVQFCCRTAKTFVVSLTDFYLSANNTCSLEWSRLSLLPASHPVHSYLIQLNPQPDAPPPTTLVLSHNRSMSFMKIPRTPGDSHCFRDDSSCRHSPNTTTIRRKERCKCSRQSKERSHAELASGWQMNWGSISSRRGPFIFALCVTRVVWETFVWRGKPLPS